MSCKIMRRFLFAINHQGGIRQFIFLFKYTEASRRIPISPIIIRTLFKINYRASRQNLKFRLSTIKTIIITIKLSTSEQEIFVFCTPLTGP